MVALDKLKPNLANVCFLY